MNIKNYINFNPVRTLAALVVLSQSVIILFALLNTWSEGVILAVEGVSAAFWATVGTLFTESKVASVAALEALDPAKPNE